MSLEYGIYLVPWQELTEQWAHSPPEDEVDDWLTDRWPASMWHPGGERGCDEATRSWILVSEFSELLREIADEDERTEVQAVEAVLRRIGIVENEDCEYDPVRELDVGELWADEVFASFSDPTVRELTEAGAAIDLEALRGPMEGLEGESSRVPDFETLRGIAESWLDVFRTASERGLGVIVTTG